MEAEGLDAVYEKIKSALVIELQDPSWILLKEDQRVIVERRRGDADLDVLSSGLQDDVVVKQEPLTLTPITGSAEDEVIAAVKRAILHDGSSILSPIHESRGGAFDGPFDIGEAQDDDEPSCKVENILVGENEVRAENEVHYGAETKRKRRGRPPKIDAAHRSSLGDDRRPPSRFPCKNCDATFRDKLSLARHVRWKHPDAAVPPRRSKPCCFVCGAAFRLKSRLRKHLTDAHPDEPVACHVCGRETPNFAKLTRHLKKDHDGAVCHLCDWCGARLGGEEAMVAHAKDVHRVEVKTVACPVCRRELLSADQVRTHLSRAHHLDVFENEENEENAKENAASLDSAKLECQICKRLFLRAVEAVGHDHPDAEKKLLKRKICTHCGKFVTNLVEHVARTHSKEQQFPCKECEKTFPSRGKLNEHAKTVHSGQSKAICDVCGKQFSNVHKAKRHMVAIHFQEKCFCEVCGKECPHKEALYAHVIRNHSGKVYHCEVCGQKFSLPENMKRHVQTVHMKSKISCEECGKEFTCKDHLRRHAKSVHEGKRHQCLYCVKNYSQAGDLHRHMKLAHGMPGSNQLKMQQGRNVKTNSEMVVDSIDPILSTTDPAKEERRTEKSVSSKPHPHRSLVLETLPTFLADSSVDSATQGLKVDLRPYYSLNAKEFSTSSASNLDASDAFATPTIAASALSSYSPPPPLTAMGVASQLASH